MKVLIAYDGSAYADAALNDLRRAGLPRETEALIVAVSESLVNPSPSVIAGTALTPRSVPRALGLAQAQAAQALEQAKEFAAKADDRVRSYFPDWEVRAEGIAGTPSQELGQKADEWKPDLIVVGSPGRPTLGRFFLGSVSKKLATEARSSVRVARRIVEKSEDAPPRIMIAVDGSPGAERAVRAVGRRVWSGGTEVRIVAVDDSVSPARIARILPTAASMIRSSNEEAAAKARQMVEWADHELRVIGLRVAVAIEQGEPQRILIEEARKWDADCIFVGARGLDNPDERLGLGGVSTGLVTNASCTVEIVR
jgi:nucleotide-binding universal stress UspA family protein